MGEGGGGALPQAATTKWKMKLDHGGLTNHGNSRGPLCIQSLTTKLLTHKRPYVWLQEATQPGTLRSCEILYMANLSRCPWGTQVTSPATTGDVHPSTPVYILAGVLVFTVCHLTCHTCRVRSFSRISVC